MSGGQVGVGRNEAATLNIELPLPIRPLRLVASLLALLLVAGCDGGTGDQGSVSTPSPTTLASAASPSGLPAPSGTEPTDSLTLRAYYFLGSFTGNAGLAPVLRQTAKTVAVGAAAMADLLDGPLAAELGARPAMYTDIPAGTRFLGLTIDSGVATVNLSREFTSGGVRSTVVGRFAQVVFTLTQFPTIQRVQFEVDGQAIGPAVSDASRALGPSSSVTRADYRDQVPAIFVDRPAWGDVLGSPARISGMADVFEATFRIAILDGSGTVLVDRQAMASCGTGCWGAFDVTIPYHVGSAGWGKLRVYDLSAQDGSRQHVTDYPVWLTPAG